MAKGTGAAAVTSATATLAAIGLDSQQVWAVALCLLGVLLSRLIYIGREERRGHHTSFRESAALTLLSMLLAGALVADRHIDMWKAPFVGAGVGWVPDAILDFLGGYALGLIRGLPDYLRGAASQKPPPKLGDMAGLHDLPPEMQDLVGLVDQADEHQRRPRPHKRRPHGGLRNDDSA